MLILKRDKFAKPQKSQFAKPVCRHAWDRAYAGDGGDVDDCGRRRSVACHSFRRLKKLEKYLHTSAVPLRLTSYIQHAEISLAPNPLEKSAEKRFVSSALS